MPEVLNGCAGDFKDNNGLKKLALSAFCVLLVSRCARDHISYLFYSARNFKTVNLIAHSQKGSFWGLHFLLGFFAGGFAPITQPAAPAQQKPEGPTVLSFHLGVTRGSEGGVSASSTQCTVA